MFVILWIASLLTLSNSQFTPAEDQPDELANKEHLYASCTPKVCNGRGRCYIGREQQPSCMCYEQYFSGPYCEDPAIPCKIRSELTGTCALTGTCVSYFGNTYCSCMSLMYYGRFCQYSTGITSVLPLMPGIYAMLQPIQQREYSVYVVYVSSSSKFEKIRAVIEGFVYDLKQKDFKELDVRVEVGAQMKLPKNYGPNQNRGFEKKHKFLQRGLGMFLARVFVKDDPGGADYLFQYDVITAKGKCIPSIQVIGGSCA